MPLAEERQDRGLGAPPFLERPALVVDVPGNVASAILATPRGIILHATRSGRAYNERQEWGGTVNYVRGGSAGLGWHVTAGPGLLAIHMRPDQWGFNAREHSAQYLAIELAQANYGEAIAPATLDAAAWWITNVALVRWPRLPLDLVHHAELPAGRRDGKSDVWLPGAPEGEALKRELLARL